MSLSHELQQQRNDHASPDMLCQCCENFVQRVGWPPYMSAIPATSATYPHYQTGIELINGAENHCHLCSIIFSTCEASDVITLGGIVAHIKRCDNKWTTLCSVIWTPSEDHSNQIYMTDILNELRSRRPYHPSATRTSNASDDAVALISAWILPNALTNTRAMSNYAHRLPRRVLDLGTEEEGGSIKIVSGEALIQADYVTLSHTWGGTRPAFLTIDNSSQSHNLIPLTQLPKTFQHAIWLTRKVKLRYLWIDALCILHQNYEDWREESRKMGEIYEESLFTISASDAQNCASGFFQLRNPLIHLECHFKDKNDRTLIIPPRCYPEDGLESNLDKRGWILQERILSTRNVHFHNSWIFLEKRVSPLEKGGGGAGFSIDRALDHRSQILCEQHSEKPCVSKDVGLRAIFNRAVARSSHDPDFSWWQIVSKYSSADLTYKSDRLIAMAGLVTRMQKFMRRAYSFGHWVLALDRGLLWRVERPGIRVSRRAPSWSWASISGSRIDRSSLHDMDSVRRGVVYQEAKVTKLPEMTDNIGVAKCPATDELCSIYLRAPVVGGTILEGSRILLTRQLKDSALNFRRDDNDNPDISVGSEVVCALICTGRGEPHRTDQAEFIVLNKQPNRRNFYHRIGFAVEQGIQNHYEQALDYLKGLEMADIIIL